MQGFMLSKYKHILTCTGSGTSYPYLLSDLSWNPQSMFVVTMLIALSGRVTRCLVENVDSGSLQSNQVTPGIFMLST